MVAAGVGAAVGAATGVSVIWPISLRKAKFSGDRSSAMINSKWLGSKRIIRMKAFVLHPHQVRSAR